MPHVCGDEPEYRFANGSAATVCPTCVGMNRLMTSCWASIWSMPHVCGDEPMTKERLASYISYAPRVWG